MMYAVNGTNSNKSSSGKPNGPLICSFYVSDLKNTLIHDTNLIEYTKQLVLLSSYNFTHLTKYAANEYRGKVSLRFRTRARVKQKISTLNQTVGKTKDLKTLTV